MIYMPGGRSLVNNSIFNLVLMLAGFSSTSFSLVSTFIRSLYVFVLPRRRFLPYTTSPPLRLPFSLIYFLASFLSSALIPPCRRPDKGEISTARANKFLHRRPSSPRTFPRPRLVIKSGGIRRRKRKRVFHF